MIKSEPLITDLIGGKATKTDSRIAFFCAADELSAQIVLLTHSLKSEELRANLQGIAETLSDIMGEAAGGAFRTGETQIERLLALIKKYEAPPLKKFILPGKTPAGAQANAVRTVARRAELAYAHVYEACGGSVYVFEYLNKLSTLFFALARKLDEKQLL